jgi:RNA polymerase sigma-70 factor (ECF subfamily)
VEIASDAIGIEPIAMARPKSNPQERLRRVFDRTGDALYRFILIRVHGDRHAADELLQQACHVAARHRRMPKDDSECEAWLRGIAKNLIRRHWRRNRKRRAHRSLEDVDVARQLAEDMEARPLPPDALIREETARQALLAVTSLPAAEQELVLAFYFEGRSQTDIAETLGVSVKSVETRLYRVRHRLRAILHNMRKD